MPDCRMYFVVPVRIMMLHAVFCPVLVSDRSQLDACPMLSSSAPALYCRPPVVDVDQSVSIDMRKTTTCSITLPHRIISPNLTIIIRHCRPLTVLIVEFTAYVISGSAKYRVATTYTHTSCLHLSYPNAKC